MRLDIFAILCYCGQTFSGHGNLMSMLCMSDVDERTIYVRGLDEKVTKELLEELFIQVKTGIIISLPDHL